MGKKHSWFDILMNVVSIGNFIMNFTNPVGLPMKIMGGAMKQLKGLTFAKNTAQGVEMELEEIIYTGEYLAPSPEASTEELSLMEKNEIIPEQFYIFRYWLDGILTEWIIELKYDEKIYYYEYKGEEEQFTIIDNTQEGEESTIDPMFGLVIQVKYSSPFLTIHVHTHNNACHIFVLTHYDVYGYRL